MNKYLLLRDNKQSGPYSVAEIIEKGIKPYDLVWLEGKSAAWRYPSEIEELKAYAPATEEQPFDRFYKKPDQVAETQHSRFEPKPVAEPVINIQPSKKVYINFPGIQKKAQESKPVAVAAEVFTEEKKVPEPIIKYAEQPVIKTVNDKTLYITGIASCVLLIALISYFVINSNNQKKDINELNALVHQLEQKTKEENTKVLPAVNNDVKEEIQTADPVITEPSTPVISKKPATTIQEVKATPPTVPSSLPVKPAAEQPEKITPPPVHENLFKLVSVKSNKYKTGVLGGISNLQLELTNNSLVELQKVVVEIKYLGPEKKVVRTQTVFFENVRPGSQSVIAVPKSNRGVTIDYIITDIKS